MEVFVVGGAVRDILLGLEPKDLDFVVVGSTPEEMIEAGFTQVGADFPVFLDDLGREFALARTERKTGQKHTDFVTEFDPEVTLEDDLRRRDLTINAMAVRMEDWNDFIEFGEHEFLIDPFNGHHDVRLGHLQAVSEAFSEDPLRVLRVARFAARLNFRIALGLRDTMQEIAIRGDLRHLSKERIWKEMSRAMMEKAPHNFFDVLKKTWAMDAICGEDSLTAFMGVRDRLIKLSSAKASEVQRWMSLFYDTDKLAVDEFCGMHTLPSEISKAIAFGLHMSSAVFNGSDQIMEVCKQFQVWQDQSLLAEFVEMINIIEPNWSHRLEGLVDTIATASNIGFDALSADEREALAGPEIGEAIAKKRKDVIVKWQDAA